MASCSSCSSKAQHTNAINDNCTDNAGNICILATRVFDSVKSLLDAAECTLEVLSPAATPVSIIAATTQQNTFDCTNATVTDYDERYKLLTTAIKAQGICTYTDEDGNVLTSPCLFTFDYTALMRYPLDALLAAQPVCIGNASIIRAVAQGNNTFACLCDGVLLVSICSPQPCFVPLMGTLCPTDITCRQPARETVNGKTLFPTFVANDKA